MAKILTPLQPAPVMDIARELLPPGMELVVVEPGKPEFYDAAGDAEYYLGSPRAGIGNEFFRAAPRLKLVQLTSAGYDRVDIEAARKAGVPVANNGGANSVAVAEHAVMLMLAVLKRLVANHNEVVAGKWRTAEFAASRLYEVEGKRLGIVGLGNIGKKVARRVRGFDMDVRYFDILRLSGDQEDALGVRFALFPELLRTSDVVIPARAAERRHPQDDVRARVRADEAHRRSHQHLPGPGRRRGGPLSGAHVEDDCRGRPRRDGAGAAGSEPPALLAPERHPDAAQRRADVGQLDEGVPQRLRQHRACGGRAGTPLGRPRATDRRRIARP